MRSPLELVSTEQAARGLAFAERGDRNHLLVVDDDLAHSVLGVHARTFAGLVEDERATVCWNSPRAATGRLAVFRENTIR